MNMMNPQIKLVEGGNILDSDKDTLLVPIRRHHPKIHENIKVIERKYPSVLRAYKQKHKEKLIRDYLPYMWKNPGAQFQLLIVPYSNQLGLYELSAMIAKLIRTGEWDNLEIGSLAIPSLFRDEFNTWWSYMQDYLEEHKEFEIEVHV